MRPPRRDPQHQEGMIPMRTINWDAPLSDEDKAWLRQRDKHAEIEANEAKFAEATKQSDDDGDNGPDDEYDSWKVAELVAEAGERKPPVDLTGITLKADIIAALRTWDAEHPEAFQD